MHGKMTRRCRKCSSASTQQTSLPLIQGEGLSDEDRLTAVPVKFTKSVLINTTNGAMRVYENSIAMVTFDTLRSMNEDSVYDFFNSSDERKFEEYNGS